MTESLFNEANEKYENGEFVEAFHLFMEAANKGDESAMGRLACMYADGEGVERSYQKSIEWDTKAIKCGAKLSILNLGITYRMMGDILKAKECFRESAHLGDADAALNLAKLYMVSEKETEAIKKYLNIALANASDDAELVAEAMNYLSLYT